jgi:DNA polymerase III subunit gamma/tau
MSYQVLARKYRPKSFDTLIGQEHVVRALSNALEQQRLHHAYLLTGTRGVGKTTIARILAKSLNCETGITAHPCGVCSSCTEIDKGRFIDLIEVDAASNTQVDNMRDLLDNAQYAPTSGRFKVYIIDEVHMLTRNSFNAMLKTLEEPPAHVKFILATTDPQKLPVTVLSRCLQFNLRQMSSVAISEHCANILKTEGIPFEPTALHMIAKAASGSMRDALSLLDQAIAYGNQSVSEHEVKSMLGAIDQSYLYDIVFALINGDGHQLMNIAKTMSERSLSFEAALGDLANLFQQIAMIQVVPDMLAKDLPERSTLIEIADKLSPEKNQLFYQICLLGRRDLGLAPDEFAGFSMTLLRMLAFRQSTITSTNTSVTTPNTPVDIPRSASSLVAQKKATNQEPTQGSTPVNPGLAISPSDEQASSKANLSKTATEPINSNEINNLPPVEITIEQPEKNSSSPAFNGNWRDLVNNLKLGLARTLATHCEFVKFEDNQLYLTVPESQKHLLESTYQDKLSQAINEFFGKRIHIHLQIGGTGNTPAKQISEEKAEIQSNAENAIAQDEFIQSLIKDFGGQIISSSVKPIG